MKSFYSQRLRAGGEPGQSRDVEARDGERLPLGALADGGAGRGLRPAGRGLRPAGRGPRPAGRGFKPGADGEAGQRE